MNFLDLFISGLQGLADHLFRTFLTMLGIVFGVAAVIAMVSIGAGAEKETLEELKKFGTDSIRVNANILEGEPLNEAIKLYSRGLSRSDAQYLMENFDFLDLVVEEKLIDAKVYAMGAKPLAQVVGVGDRFLEASRFELLNGRFINKTDLDRATSVAVLGFQVANKIFGQNDPVGEVIQIGRYRFLIVGVMKGQGSGEGKLAIKSRNHDSDVYVPLSAALERLSKEKAEDKDLFHEVSSLWIKVKEGFDIVKADQVVTQILRRRHRDVECFETIVPLEILKQSQKTQDLFNLVMALIAAISLLVGGIGIMNIMLASVNERTREIGVRRAMGASKQNIVAQFLTEAILISMSGGLAGVIGGTVLSLSISLYTGWTTVIPISSVFLAFFVSVSVGIIFGAFPAFKAAKLDPVIALKYE